MNMPTLFLILILAVSLPRVKCQPRVDSISAGEHHTCMVTLGQLRCLGEAEEGQIGTGSKTPLGDKTVRGRIECCNHVCALIVCKM